MTGLKRIELPKELLEQMDEMGELLKKFALDTGETNTLQKFLRIRSQEVWQQSEVKWLIGLFVNIALTYIPEAPLSHRLTQEMAARVVEGLTVASAREDERDPTKKINIGPMPLGFVKLSEETVEKLNQCYADFYLIRHKEPKAQQILEALPFITNSGETMAWFTARIVNICRKKSLRLSFEKDLAAAGMKFIETKRTFSVVYSDISAKEEAELRDTADIVVGKKGGLS